MMGTSHIGIVHQGVVQQVLYCTVGFTHDTAVELDSSFGKGHLCTAANTTADQHVDTIGTQETGQSAVTAAVGGLHFGRNDLAVLHGIELHIFRVAKMLEYLTVVVSNCNFHKNALRFHSFCLYYRAE